MGGEGFADELDLIRAGKITAVNVISSEWVGWASVDTMNSVFLSQKPADSGIGWTMVDATTTCRPRVSSSRRSTSRPSTRRRGASAHEPSGCTPPAPQPNQRRDGSVIRRGARPGAPPPGPALRIAHLSKTFPGTRALIDVSFDVRPGARSTRCWAATDPASRPSSRSWPASTTATPAGTITVGGTTTRQRPDHARTRPRRRACTSCTRTRRCSRRCRWPTTSPSAAASRPPGGVDPVAGASPAHPGPARPLRHRRVARHAGAGRCGRPSGPWWPSCGRVQDQEGEHSGVLVLDEPTASLPRAEVIRLMGALNRFARSRPDHPVRQPPPRRGHRHRRPGDGAARRAAGRHPRRRRHHREPPDRAHRRPGPRPHVPGDAGGRPPTRWPSRSRGSPVDRCGASTCSCAGRGAGHRRAAGLGAVRAAQDDLRRLPDPIGHRRARRVGRSALPPHRRRHGRRGRPTCPRTAAARPSFPDLTLSENLAAAMVDRYWQRLAPAPPPGRPPRPAQSIGAVLHPGLVGAPGDGHAVGRQPAEGDPGPLAASATPRCCCWTSPPRAWT